MSHHRRRPPIRLRKQWERDRDSWWRANMPAPLETTGKFTSVSEIVFGEWAPGLGFQMLSVIGKDEHGHNVTDELVLPVMPECPIPVFPRRSR